MTLITWHRFRHFVTRLFFCEIETHLVTLLLPPSGGSLVSVAIALIPFLAEAGFMGFPPNYTVPVVTSSMRVHDSNRWCLADIVRNLYDWFEQPYSRTVYYQNRQETV